jgi:chemotaxis protein CheC
MEQTLELGVMEQSVVKELANIGLGHATTALSNLTGRPFNMSVPFVESIALEEIPLQLGAQEGISVGITMPIAGDAEGHIMFLTDWESAQGLWTMLLGSAPSDPWGVGELEASAMLEIGNIINSSFLSAIADMTNLEASFSEHYALAIRTEIHDLAGTFKGFFLYVPTMDGLKNAFRQLGLPEAA